jgi:hypothetical protein
MINNNMDMIEQMKNYSDYEEYISTCKEKGLEVRNPQQFYMCVGIIKEGRRKYPSLSWQESYTKVFNAMQEALEMPLADDKCCGNEEKEDKPLPSLSKRALNYTKTQAAWIAAGRPVVDEETYLRRLSICGVGEDIKCEELTKREECSKCGCPMRKKAKQDMQGLCALNKW